MFREALFSLNLIFSVLSDKWFSLVEPEKTSG